MYDNVVNDTVNNVVNHTINNVVNDTVNNVVNDTVNNVVTNPQIYAIYDWLAYNENKESSTESGQQTWVYHHKVQSDISHMFVNMFRI